ncbi:MAG: SMP-30/gluconolactonase/LRE family protein, partial [Bryobacteraceae bacterium]|nr:SMP-30/gluconolactonase/LRE family protein [Bryobacteraceae bacterium]
MKRRSFISALGAAGAMFAQEANQYPLGPDSQRQPGVPKGTVTQQPPWKSAIFPGTVRDWWIYVPAQYKAETPASVMVVQDGGGWVRDEGGIRAPIVFDNLIDKGQMPVTIGVFINPGVLPALADGAQPRFNRSFEYDAVSDRYARFLIEEILPEVRKNYNLSKDPNDYGIGGSSSGASCAFTAAWHRPDVFRRVHSWIGSYTNLRGAEVYPDLIRKTEAKPLRIFLQDGKRDNNIYAGNWFIANQDMASALEFAGYDAQLIVGEEAHNSRHGAAILPDSLRWLWRDHPKPITKPSSARQTIATFLDPASEWELVSSGHRFTEGPAVDKAGNVFFTDIPNNRIHRIDAATGKVSVFKEDTGGVNGTMFGPDGRLYACQNGRKKIVAYTTDGAESVIAEGLDSNDLCINARGELYVTDPPNKRVWFIDAKGSKRIVIDKGLEFPNGVRLSADHSLLLVVDMRNKWVWSYQVQPDGSVLHGQAFYRLEVPDDSSQSGGDGMTVDSEGFLYVTTRIGVQICDQPGRVNGIINKPHPGSLSNAVFGGPQFDWLFV